jgi:DNA-binding protein HU-beta
MAQTNLLKTVATTLELSKKDATACLEAVINGIEQTLIENGEVRISKLGTFRISKTKARNGINPKTGERIEIPESNRVYFRPYKGLKETAKNYTPAVKVSVSKKATVTPKKVIKKK